MPDSGNRAVDVGEEAVWVCMTIPCGLGVEWCVGGNIEKGVTLFLNVIKC